MDWMEIFYTGGGNVSVRPRTERETQRGLDPTGAQRPFRHRLSLDAVGSVDDNPYSKIGMASPGTTRRSGAIHACVIEPFPG